MALKLSHFRAILLAGASAVAVSSAAQAAPRVIFTAGSGVAQGAIAPGQQIASQGGVTQVQLDSGAIVAFVGPATFSLGADGVLQVESGNVTLAGGTGPSVIRLANGGSLSASAGASASFAITPSGTIAGQVMTGSATLATAGGSQTFTNAQFFSAQPGGAPTQTFAGLAPQATPGVSGGINIGGYNPVLNAAIQQNPALTTFPIGQSQSQIASYLVALGQTIGQLYSPAQLLQLAQQYGPQTPTPTPTTPTPTPTTPTPTPTTPTPTPTTPTPTPTTPTPTPTTPTPTPTTPNASGLTDGQTVPVVAWGRTTTANEIAGTGDAGSFVVDVDANGNPDRFGTVSVTTATLAEVQSAAGWTLGRYANGAVQQTSGSTVNTRTYGANNGLLFAAVTPVTGALPTSGVAIYDSIAASTPIQYDGVTAPGGSFTAKLGISLGTTRQLGFEGTLNLSQGSGAGAYAFSTAGGAAAPSVGTVYGSGQQLYFDGRAPVTTTGSLCGAGGCLMYMRGGLGGADGRFAAALYEMLDVTSNGYKAGGTAVFDRTAVNTPTPTPTTPTPTPTFTPIAAAAEYNGALALLFDQAGSNDFGSRPQVERAAATFNTDGGLETLALAGGGIARGSAKLTDIGGDATVTVGRWHDGTFTDRTSNPISGSSNTGVLPVNGGLHYALGIPSGALPVSGSATYDLLAATRPTISDGSLAPGVFAGQMAVAFGYTPRVGLEGSVTMTESGAPVVYSFTTPGGVAGAAATGSPIQFASGFNGNIALTGTGAACSASCRFYYTGGFAGAGFDHAFLNYTFGSTLSPAVFVQGAAAFKSAAPTGVSSAEVAGTSSGSVSAGFSGTGNVSMALPGGRNAQRDINFSSSNSTITAGGDGVITAFTAPGTSYERRTASVAELAGTADWQVGRWNGGRVGLGGAMAEYDALLSPNQGLAYAAVKPLSGTMPVSGTAQYTLVGATKPVYSNDATAPGTFTANMGVSFAATPKIGMDGVITMPDATYSFSTPGGAANPATSDSSSFVSSGQRNFSIYRTATAPAGGSTACASATSCSVYVTGQFGGAAGEYAGLSYIVSEFGEFTRPSVGGAAVFKAGPVTGGAEPVTGTERTGQVMVYAGDTIGVDTRSAVTTADADGRINKYVASANEALERGSNTGYEVGKAGTGDVIVWTRWAGGTTGGQYFSSAPVTRNDNQGFHLVSGDRATNLPTVGSATYSLAGHTKPTHGGGVIVPGTFTGSLGVAFGSSVKVGFDLRPTVDGQTYVLATPGGSATPASSPIVLNSNMTFSSAPSGDVPVAAGGICPSGCNAYVQGFLAGDGASHAGIAYNFGPGGNGGAANRIFGSAAFTRTSYDSSPAVDPNATPPVSSGSLSAPLRVLTTSNSMFGAALLGPSSPVSEASIASAITTDSTGLLTGFAANGNGSSVWTRNNAVTADATGTRYVQIGRWNGGDIQRDGSTVISPDGSRGLVYALGAPLNTSFLPRSITATYSLLGSTSAFSNGLYGPGSLQGSAAVAFSSTGSWKLGLSANLTTTEANGQVVYDLSTLGGAADPSQSQIQGTIAFYDVASPTGSSVCTGATCSVSVRGIVLAGPDARDAAMAYRVGSNASNSIIGAAIFQRNDDPALFRKDLGYAGISLSPGGQVVTNAVGLQNHNSPNSSTLTRTAGGDIASIESNNGYSGIGTAQAVNGSAGGLSWARWSNGAVQTNVNGTTATYGANTATHVIVGDPTATMPTTGTATFSLAGATAPTIADGSVAPGTFAGSMAVQFGSSSASRVGFDFDVTIGGHTYDLVTPGGLGDINQSAYRIVNGGFGSYANQSVNLSVTAGGPACTGTACRATVGGFFTGPGATGAGVSYTISDFGSPNNATAVQGVAAFTRN